MPAVNSESTPVPALAHFVECLWTVNAAADDPDYPVLPDGCLDIVFSAKDGVRAIGAMTKRQIHAQQAGQFVVGMRFRPGLAARLLRVAACELTDGAASMEELWGKTGRELHARLQEARSATACQAALACSLRFSGWNETPTQKAVAAIVAAEGDVRLDYIAGQANLSSRQFRRRCLEETGLTPKHLCRVLRFQRALRLLASADSAGAAGVAADCGYYDQAHLIRDFREFAAATPSAYASRRMPGIESETLSHLVIVRFLQYPIRAGG